MGRLRAGSSSTSLSSCSRFDGAYHVVRGEPAVGHASDEKAQIRLHIEGVGRHAQVNARRGTGRVANRAGVADGAIHAETVDINAPSPEADGNILAGFEHESEGRIAVAGELVRKHVGQHFPDPVRDAVGYRAGSRLASNGAVFEVVLDGRVAH